MIQKGSRRNFHLTIIEVNERVIDVALQIKNVIKRNFVFPLVLVGQQEKSGILTWVYHDFMRYVLTEQSSSEPPKM